MPWNSNIGTYEGLMSAWLRFAKWTVKLFVKRPFRDFLLPEGGKSADQGTIWEGLGMLVIFTRKFVPAAFHELISLISISIIHRSISSIFQVVDPLGSTCPELELQDASHGSTQILRDEWSIVGAKEPFDQWGQLGS